MADLAARFVRYQDMPRYPTKLDVLDAPDLLRRHVPPAWLGRREIAGALGAFLAAGAAGCRTASPAVQPTPDIKHKTPVGTVIAPVFKQEERIIALSSGPVAAYLTEEEGLQIVLQELQRCDLNMSLSDVQFGTDEQPLRIDLMDPERHVAVEFFSSSDDPNVDRLGALFRLDALSMAKRVAERGNDVYLGVVYDPATLYYVGRGIIPTGDDEEDQHREEQARLKAEADRSKAIEESKRILREQVQSFTDWLTAQGVI